MDDTDPQSSWEPRIISDEEFERTQRRMRRDDLRCEADLPDAAVAWWRFRNKVLETPAWAHAAPSSKGPWDNAYNVARRRVESRNERDTGLIVGLVGRHGSGKTVMATGLMLLVTARLQSARYTTLFDVSLSLEAALESHGETTREEVVASYRQPRLLVIDDCSACAGSESESRFLRGILDHRYYKKRDTILISNDSSEGFSSFIGKANMNRLNQGGGIIECNWECFRK
jgi:DNA replication protein DnaC